jgi:hypothetical protein
LARECLFALLVFLRARDQNACRETHHETDNKGETEPRDGPYSKTDGG